MFYDEELERSEKFYQRQPLILQLCYALYNMLVAHSEMVCYLVIIINHMVSASCATLVLPITIFLWAMLSVPRPSKRYWMTAIIYTEVRSDMETSQNIRFSKRLQNSLSKFCTIFYCLSFGDSVFLMVDISFRKNKALV